MQAQHGWTVNAADFASTGQVTAAVNFDGVQVTSGTLGAFVDDECRGFVDALFFPPSNWYTFELLANSNQTSGEILTFRYYNPDDGLIYDVNETIEFVADMREGNSADPLNYSVTLNGPPLVDAPIGDLSLNEYFGSTTIDLSTVFSDPDSDPLTYSAISSKLNVVTVSLAVSILTITEAGLGSSTVTVTADDGSETTDDIFTVTVNDINGAPVVDNPLEDLELQEYFETRTVDLTGIFSDPDAGDVLALTAVSSHPAVVTVSLSGTDLIISEAGLGTSTITVTADDGLLSVDERFTVTVSNVNDPPVVVQPIGDLLLDEYFGTYSILLTEVFSDKDEDELVFSAQSSAPAVVTVAVKGNRLTIGEVGFGTSLITVTASDGELSAEEQFNVTVSNVNDAPEIMVPVPDQNIVENIGSAELDLNLYFSDRDGDKLVYSVELRNTGIVSYELDQSLLLLTPLEEGSTMVTITASDPEGLTATDSFMVHVEKELMFIVRYDSRRLQNQDTIILCNDAGQIAVKVITKATWGLTNNYLWMALEIKQDSTLSVAFSPNLTGSDRIGDVTLFDEQGHVLKFFVKQTEHCLTNVVPGDRRFDLKMYPNPVEGRLFIERLRRGMKVEVIDQQGKLLYIEEVLNDVPGAPLMIDMRGYMGGLYLIRISDERGSFTGKIVKH